MRSRDATGRDAGGRSVAVDLAELEPPPPSDPNQLAALLDVEERLGATDPYRQLGHLTHLILRQADTARGDCAVADASDLDGLLRYLITATS